MYQYLEQLSNYLYENHPKIFNLIAYVYSEFRELSIYPKVILARPELIAFCCIILFLLIMDVLHTSLGA